MFTTEAPSDQHVFPGCLRCGREIQDDLAGRIRFLSQTDQQRRWLKRRQAVEPAIGHMKMDGRLGRNPLKGALGDALHAVMCGAGHNLRMILAALRLCCARIRLSMQAVIAALLAAAW